MRREQWLGVWILVATTWTVQAAEVGLVTAMSGSIRLQDDKSASSQLKPFVKIREGDKLHLEANPRVQLVYFESGLQETWVGTGAIEIGSTASKTLSGNLLPEVKTLPPILVKQLSKTPAPDGSMKSGMVRLRSIAPPQDGIDSIEKEYAEMRNQASTDDRSPELYLLASYLELKQFDKIDALLRSMREKSPGDAEVAALNALYTRAIADARGEKK